MIAGFLPCANLEVLPMLYTYITASYLVTDVFSVWRALHIPKWLCIRLGNSHNVFWQFWVFVTWGDHLNENEHRTSRVTWGTPSLAPYWPSGGNWFGWIRRSGPYVCPFLLTVDLTLLWSRLAHVQHTITYPRTTPVKTSMVVGSWDCLLPCGCLERIPRLWVTEL